MDDDFLSEKSYDDHDNMDIEDEVSETSYNIIIYITIAIIFLILLLWFIFSFSSSGTDIKMLSLITDKSLQIQPSSDSYSMQSLI